MSKPKIQPSLFDDMDNNINQNEINQINLIKINTKRELSKVEINFNKLSEKLFKKQEIYESSLDNDVKIRQFYATNVFPLLQDITKIDAELLKLIFKNYIKLNPIKFSISEKTKTENVIAFFLLEVKPLVYEDSELMDILNYYDKEVLKSSEEENENEEFEDEENEDIFIPTELFENFLKEYNNGLLSEGDKKFIKENGKAEFMLNILKNKNIKSSQKKKSKKQIEKELQKELAQKEKENLKNKSLKSIYINLAKLLHPDTETDEETKLFKEEIMKKITIAYNNKDIFTLLKLEMEWIKKEEKNLNNIPTSTIKLYNEILLEQIKELENNIENLNINMYVSKIISDESIHISNFNKCMNYLLEEKNELELQKELNLNFLNELKETNFTFANFKKTIHTILDDLESVMY